MGDHRPTLIGSAAVLDPDFDLEDATLDLTVAGANRESALLSEASASARAEPDIFSSEQAMGEDPPRMENAVLGGSLLHFDPSNWFLDENLVDLGLGETWNEPQSADYWSPLRLQTLSAADLINQTPNVLDLQQIWYNHARRTIDSLHDDYETTRRPDAATLRRDTSIDETYRTHMVEELSPRVRNEPLPSLEFLVLRRIPVLTLLSV